MTTLVLPLRPVRNRAQRRAQQPRISPHAPRDSRAAVLERHHEHATAAHLQAAQAAQAAETEPLERDSEGLRRYTLGELEQQRHQHQLEEQHYAAMAEHLQAAQAAGRLWQRSRQLLLAIAAQAAETEPLELAVLPGETPSRPLSELAPPPLRAELQTLSLRTHAPCPLLVAHPRRHAT